MATPKQITFTYRELAELLAREARLETGLWGLFIKFGLSASNVGTTSDDLKPAAIVPVMEIGIQEFASPNNLTIDVARLQPQRKANGRSAKKK